MFTKIAAAAAVLLAAAALAVSLTHAGPKGAAGAAGPAGHTGQNAEVAHLGLCINMAVQTGVVYLPVDTADPITAPVLTDGVPSCPAGQFVSIVPQSAGQ